MNIAPRQVPKKPFAQALATGLIALAGLSNVAALPAFGQRQNQPQAVIIQGLEGMEVGIQPKRMTVAADPTGPARLQELVTSLGSSDHEVREEATGKLMKDPGISLGMIERVLKNAEAPGALLSLETRQRLASASRERFWRTPRGALGIQFWNNLRDRVVVERTFRGFESAEKLEDGDMVVEADGLKIEGYMARNRLQAIIVSHEPGESIRLSVRRGEQKLEIDVQLGKRDDLENSALTEEIVARAWQVRSAAYRLRTGEAIDPKIKAGDWKVDSFAQDRANRMVYRSKGIELPGPNAVGGGMPRGAALTVDQLNVRFASGPFRNNRAQAMMWQQGGFQGWDPNAEPTIPPMTRRQELDEMLRARVKIAKELESLVPDPSRPPQERELEARTYDERAKMLGLIEKQTRALKAEMTEHNEPFEEPTSAVTSGEDDQPAEDKAP